jgi:uncharacterized protein (TIGR02217 family)
MSDPPVFPSLPGCGWSVTKAPRFQTRTQKAVSGRQLRIADQQSPIWTFTLTFPLLRDAHDTRAGSGVGLGIGYDELRTLAGFFLAAQGAYGTFLFADPSDNQVTGQPTATGDGTTTAFPIVRSFGAFAEPLPAAINKTGNALLVYVNGVLQTSGVGTSSRFGFTTLADTITFAAAPAAGAAIAASFSYYFLCHFTDDAMNFENFMLQVWQAKSVKFESVLP